MKANYLAASIVAAMLAPAAHGAVIAYSLATTDRTSGTGNTFVVGRTLSPSPTLTYNSGTPSLAVTTGSSGGILYFFGNFAQQALGVGDSIQIDYTFTSGSLNALANANNTNSDGAFRVSLYDTAGTKLTSDVAGNGDNAFKDDTGYMARYRTTSTGTNGTGNYVVQRSGNPTSGQAELINSTAHPAGNAVGAATLLTPLAYSGSNLTIEGSLKFTLTAASSLTIESTVESNTAQSVIDSSTLVTSFSEFAFTINMGSNSTITFSELTVTYVPEPASLSGITLAGGMLLRRRRR